MYWLCFIYFSINLYILRIIKVIYKSTYTLFDDLCCRWRLERTEYCLWCYKNKNELWIRTFLLSYFNCLWSSPWWNWIKEPISRMECLFSLSKGDIVSVVFTGTVLSYAAFVIVVVQLTKLCFIMKCTVLVQVPGAFMAWWRYLVFLL